MKRIIALLLSLVMLLSLAACGGKDKTPASSESGTTAGASTGYQPGQAGHYTYAYWGSNPSTWSPTDWETTGETAILSRLVTPLYSYFINADGTGYDTIPDAAAELPIDVTTTYAGNETYGVPADATEGWAYEIRLNEKMVWEDGTPLTADDYIYSLSQYLNPDMMNLRSSLFTEGNAALANAKSYYNSKQTGFAYRNANENGYVFADFTKAEDGYYYTADGNAVYLDWNNTNDYYLGGWSVREYVYDGDGYIPTTAYALDEFVNEDGYVPLNDEALGYVAPTMEGWGSDVSCILSVYVELTGNDTTFEDVGVVKNGDYSFTVILNKYVSQARIADTLASCLYCVKEDLYEANKSNAGGLIKSSYGTSADKFMSYGPYKMESHQPDKETIMVKNENWYGYSDSRWDNYYQTTDIVVQYITNTATAKQLFLQGELSTYGVGADDIAAYASSDYIRYQPGDYTYSFFLNTDEASLKDRDGNGVNHSILSILDFRKALSLCVDRAEFAQTLAGYTPTYTLLNTYYSYDDVTYRYTEAGESVLKDLYNTDDPDSVTGQDIEQACALFQSAYEQAVEKGLMKEGDSVQIDYWIPTSGDTTDQNQINYMNSYLAEATIGTSLEGKVQIVSTIGEDITTNMRKGLCDMMFNSWGGAATDPYWMMLCYCVEDYNFTYGFDVYNTQWTINVNGEDVTMSPNDWYEALHDTTYAGADKDTRDAILAAMELNLLEYYGVIPMLSQGYATLYQQRVSLGSDTWVNNVIGYGSMYEWTYSMDDAEWAAYCAENNHQLQY